MTQSRSIQSNFHWIIPKNPIQSFFFNPIQFWLCFPIQFWLCFPIQSRSDFFSQSNPDLTLFFQFWAEAADSWTSNLEEHCLNLTARHINSGVRSTQLTTKLHDKKRQPRKKSRLERKNSDWKEKTWISDAKKLEYRVRKKTMFFRLGARYVGWIQGGCRLGCSYNCKNRGKCVDDEDVKKMVKNIIIEMRMSDCAKTHERVASRIFRNRAPFLKNLSADENFGILIFGRYFVQFSMY